MGYRSSFTRASAPGLPAEVRLKALTVDSRLPFAFEASVTETHFTNGYDLAERVGIC
jgi:hypothetical protein